MPNSEANNIKFPESQPLNNPKQEAFCQHYIKGLTVKEAYIRAGYSPTNASQNGYNLKTKLEVANRIEWLMYQQYSVNEVTHERIIEQYRRIAFPEITDFVDFDKDGVTLKNSKDIRKDKIAAIKSVKSTTRKRTYKDETEETTDTEIALHNQLVALQRLEILSGMHSDLNKIRTNLRTYGKDIHIDSNTNQWTIVDLDELENES